MAQSFTSDGYLVVQDEGTPLLGRKTLDFVGAGVTVTDDGINIKTVVTIPGGSGYTDEEAQDAVGTILLDSSTIDFTYNDATPSITAIVIDDSISNTKLSNMATQTIKGRTTAGTGDPEDLTASQARGVIQFLSSLTFNYAALTLADGVTYYFSTFYSEAASTSATLRQMQFPYDITITGVTITTALNTAITGGETTTIYLRIDNTTDNTLAVIDYDTNGGTFTATGLNIAVTAGQKGIIKIQPITYATNPTGTQTSVTIWYYRT